VAGGRGGHRLRSQERRQVPPAVQRSPLTPRQVLEAHKRQPAIESRFKQSKTFHEIAPVLLKSKGRIEALSSPLLPGPAGQRPPGAGPASGHGSGGDPGASTVRSAEGGPRGTPEGPGADELLPNQATIDEMAALFGGRTMDGLAARYGGGSVLILDLK